MDLDTKLYTFKVMNLMVRAVRVPPSGQIMFGGHAVVGTPGAWVVWDHHAEMTEWSDAEFRKMFEPADTETEYYLNTSCKFQ